MIETFLIIIVIVAISFGVFKLIKLICNPIKTITAILLVVPTVVTGGIALFIYKSIRNSHETASVSKNSYSNNNFYSNTTYEDFSSSDTLKKSENKKPSRAFTDAFGKTTYYDDKDNLIGASIDNGFGKETFTDAAGNYAGESYDNGLGHTIYTEKDGNITSSDTNYLGEENFSDGTITKTDSSGNKYY